MKLKEQEYRDTYCSFAAADQANLDAGVYNDDTGLFLKLLSDLRSPRPMILLTSSQASPTIKPPFGSGSNRTSSTRQFWHFVGGFLDENGIPTVLRFTEDRLWPDLLENIPHLPVQADFDGDATFCGKIGMPFDDHLGQISLPILLVGAAGGFGQASVYTTTLTGEQRCHEVHCATLAGRPAVLDFAHVDIFLAKHADTLVWKPILNWIVAHR